MEQQKRMAGDYEIKAAVSIGCKEIVIGENTGAPAGERFRCGVGERNDLFLLFHDVMVSDDYPEIAGLFGQRVQEEAESVRKEIEALGIPVSVITEADCIPDSSQNDINGKVIAIDSKVLKPEYQRADRQIYTVTGGFGASANSRGSAVYCRNVFDGKTTRFERMDVIGEIKPDRLPDWAKEKLREQSHPKKEKDHER